MKTSGKISALLILVFLGYSHQGRCQQNEELPQLGKSPVTEVISAMTPEEKAAMVVGAGLFIDPATAKMLGDDVKRMIPEPGSLASMTPNPVQPAAGRTIEIPRLGIPTMVVNDGPAGLRMLSMGEPYKCTAFPTATLLASTWDQDLVYQTGKAFGNDVLEYGVDLLLAPGMNIQRDPLCGRNFEYYSEDPFVTGKIAAAMIRGIQSQGVGTSPKHFAANNQETDRANVNTIVSERALREIYLEGFRIAVQEAVPWTVMSSYNLLNGCYTSESHDLLTEILKKEWQYRGMVMSDWNGGNDAVKQVMAGNDLMMPGPYQVEPILQAVKDGRLNEKVLDRNIENILNTVMKSPRFSNYKYSDKPDAEANAQIARRAASEGMVLLKNENGALPLEQGIKKIALFGNASYETFIGGSGSGYMPTVYRINIVDGLKNAGHVTDDSLREAYMSYIKENTPKPASMIAAMMGHRLPAPEMPVDQSLADKLAESSDVALVTIGRLSGETADRKVEGDFNLTETERTSLGNVTQAFHSRGKKVVVILNIGGVIETASWRDLPDAILLAWQPGQEAGNSVCDVITGKVNPSGKLAVTFPLAYSDAPSAGNFPGVEVKNDPIIKREVVYEEGIYVGYRYYNTFGVRTAFPFGYGMSYTSFAYSNLGLSSKKFPDKMTVSVDVTNTGQVAGREVVQLYVSAPGELDKPAEELKGFAKTGLLKPGESQTLTFTLNTRDLASFNTDRSAWIADKGRYQVRIGASSEDIRLEKPFRLANEKVIQKVNRVLVPQVPVNELKRKK